MKLEVVVIPISDVDRARATQAGAALIPVTLVFLVLAPLSGGFVSRIGPRWPMVAGILLVGVSQVWLAQLHPRSGYVSAVLPAALVRGAGLGLAVTPLTAAVLAAVGDADRGEASAINDAGSRHPTAAVPCPCST